MLYERRGRKSSNRRPRFTGGAFARQDGEHRMDQATATVIAAALALIGVLVGLVVGLQRWRSERRDTRTADFIKDRQAAYRSLWSGVEGLSVALRTEAFTGETLRDRIRDLNADLLRAGVYIDERDRELASSYVKAVEQFHLIVSSSDDPGAKVSFGDTASIPPEVIQRSRDLGVAQERVMKLRAQLVERIRLVLKGEVG